MADLEKGTVVATLRTPIPVNRHLTTVSSHLELLYGVPLVLMPFSSDDEFASLAVA